jgi:universal stress protein F
MSRQSYRKILVPVDFSDKNRDAVAAAEAVAGPDAEITLLHVIETVEHVPFDEMKDLYDRLEERADREMARLAEGGSRALQQRVVYGHRARATADFAATEGFDLVVLSSHRIDPDQPGHDWATLSYQVAILCPCSVLLVK